jgi:hypothetical protein
VRPGARARLTWRWPWPAALLWLAAWGVLQGLIALGAAPLAGVVAALALSAAGAAWARRLGASVWRQAILAGGFPLSLLVTGSAALLPAWTWGVAAALLVSIYPMRAWRDAPVFPTPHDALQGLSDRIDLPPDAPVLDAGCGLGHGLRALRREWPQARLQGIEWSGSLRWWAALRCPWAHVTRGDMWAQSWQGLALVYLFQRPESMARAWAKARAELAPGAWLVSLEFPIDGVQPTAALQRPGAKPVWLYRLGTAGPATQVGKVGADMQIKQGPRPPQAPGPQPLRKRASTCS